MTLLFPELVPPFAAVLCTGAGAVTDLRTRRIPNVLTATGFVAGFCLHGLLGGASGALLAVAAGLLCGGVFLIFFVAGGMGAGDVKLIAAAGCLAGWPHIASLLVLTVLAGGVMALLMALLRGQLRVTVRNAFVLAGHHRREGLTPHPELHVLNQSLLRLPYGVAIACGAVLTFSSVLQAGAR